MSKYNVLITTTERYDLDIEAKDEKEAITKALEILDTEQGKSDYHNDSTGTEEAYEI